VLLALMGVCTLTGTKAVVTVDQDKLETVLPSAGKAVLVLKGRYVPPLIWRACWRGWDSAPTTRSQSSVDPRLSMSFLPPTLWKRTPRRSLPPTNTDIAAVGFGKPWTNDS
jgi:hypothetical protein